MNRVQVQGIGPAPKRFVAPVQGDTYVAPPKQSADNRYADLANALGSFSSTLASLGPSKAEREAEQRQKATWQAERRIHGMTREEVRAEVENGTRPNYSDPYAQKAASAALGMKFGSDRTAQLREDMMQNFDWDSGDPEAYIQQALASDRELYGDDPNFGANYERQVSTLSSWATGFKEKRTQDNFTEDQHTAAFAVIDTMVDKQSQAGMDPEEIAKSVYNEFSNLGKDGTLGVDYDSLDQEVLNKARRIAKTNPAVAEALLSHERQGRGGFTSLANNASHRDAVLQIRSVAASAYNEQHIKEVEGQLLERNVALFSSGDADKIADYDYDNFNGTETLSSSGKEQKEAARKEFLKRSAAASHVNREEPNERLGRELRSLRLSGEKHPQLEDAVTGMADMASIDMIQDPEAAAKLQGKLETYKWMQGESTNSVLAYTSAADREFGETYIMAQKYLNQDKDDAMTTAIRAQQLTKEGAATLSRDDQADIERKVKSMADKPGMLWGRNDTKPINSSIVEQQVTRLTGLYMKLGLPSDKALDAAAESIKKNTVTYNGMVLDVNGFDLPDNFRGSVTAGIEDFLVKNEGALRDNDLEANDITIVPASSGTNSNGRFIMVYKDSPHVYVQGPDGKSVTMTLGTLRRDAHKRQQESDMKAAREASMKSSVKSKGYQEVFLGNGKNGWVNPKTREIMEPVYGEKDLQPRWKKTGKKLKIDFNKADAPRTIEEDKKLTPQMLKDFYKNK